MKKCQFCRESIDEDAIVCKYCKNKQRVLPPMTIDEKKHLIKSTLIILGVLVIYFILYFISVMINDSQNRRLITNEKKQSKNDKETYIVKSSIPVDSIFNLSSDEYYVLFYNSSDMYFDYLFNSYHGSTDIYSVILDSESSNKIITNGKSNSKASSVDELRINGTTLMQIKKGINVRYIEDVSAIKDILLEQ